MSKLVPEVNDVWEVRGAGGTTRFIITYQDIEDDFVLLYRNGEAKLWIKAEMIKEYAKYLGKSKADFNQLFEVQDDK